MTTLLFILASAATDVGVLVVDPQSVFTNEALRREVNATLAKVAPDATVLARTPHLNAACLLAHKTNIARCRGDLPASLEKLYIIDFSKGPKVTTAEIATLVR